VADTTFVDKSLLTPINAAWLNDVNTLVYKICSFTVGRNLTIAKPTGGGTTLALGVDTGGVSLSCTSGTGANIFNSAGSGTAYQFADITNTGAYLRWGVESSAGAVLFGGSSAYASVLGTQNATDLCLGTNNITRVKLLSTGGLAVNAPTSGTAFQATAVAGALAANFPGGPTKLQVTTVGALLAAATAGAGARAFVTDANATTFASVVAAGGANGVPVYSDGTNWRIG
jgi:hypothetical protein